MGVKVKERPSGSGVWWVYINHKGKRRAKKVGTDEDKAREVAKKIEAKLVLGEFGIKQRNDANIPTLKQYVK